MPSLKRSGGDRTWRWITGAPALVLMLGLGALPLLNLLAMSLADVAWSDGRSQWSFVGLDNYRALRTDPLFTAGLINTTVFALLATTSQIVLGFMLALLSSRVVRGRVVYRTVFILPILIPGIVVGAIWKLIYNYDFGLISQVLAWFGLEPIDWLGRPGTALFSVILVDIWHWTPFCYLLLLAGIENLPQDVYEAAEVDGVSRWQELVHITLPMMWPTIAATFAFRLVLAFKVFDEVFLLTGGGPGTSSEVVSFSIYQHFFVEDRVGLGSAMAIVVIVLVMLLFAAALRIGRKDAAA